MNLSKVPKRIVALLLLLVTTSTLAQSEPSEGIFVGVAIPLSGSLAGVGQSILNGAELARQAFNADRPASAQLQFVVEDSAGDPVQAVAAFERLIADDRIVAILGPVTSSAAAPAFVTAQASGMVAISPAAAAAGLSTFGDFVFTGTLPLDILIPSGLALTQERLGYERVAVVLDEEELFAQSGLTVLTGSFAERGVEVVATEGFSGEVTDFVDALNRIKATNPDMLFISTFPAEAVSILRQAQQVDLPAEVLRITPVFTADDVTSVGEAAEGLITFSTWDSANDTPGNRAFVENHRAAYDSDPNRFTAQSHAAVTLLVTAIEQARALEPAAIRDALADLRDVDTVLGAFSFDEEGGAVFDPVIRVLRDGVLVPF